MPGDVFDSLLRPDECVDSRFLILADRNQNSRGSGRLIASVSPASSSEARWMIGVAGRQLPGGHLSEPPTQMLAVHLRACDGRSPGLGLWPEARHRGADR